MSAKLKSDAAAAEYLTRVMTEQGFTPARVYNAFFVEYTKTYADAQGRVARAVVQFERPTESAISSGLRLSGFTALVQAFISAEPEAVLERAPPVMQDDFLALLAAFQERTMEQNTVAVEPCTSCGTLVAEYFVVKGETLCRACKEKG